MTDALLGGRSGGGPALCCYFCPRRRLTQRDVLGHIQTPMLCFSWRWQRCQTQGQCGKVPVN